jgi:hypothetical protein
MRPMQGVLGVAAVALVAVPLLSITLPVCACLSASEVFTSIYGVDPMTDSPDESQNALLKRLPNGSTREELNRALPIYIILSHCKDSDDGMSVRCIFDVQKDLFGRRDGFEFEVKLNQARRVETIEFRTYKRRS